MAPHNPKQCIRCYKLGHQHSKCQAFQVLSCYHCYKLNVLTKRCCELPRMASYRYTMELRLANSRYGIPRIYVDIKILGRVFAACINTYSRRTLVDFAVMVLISRRDPDSIKNHISPYDEPTIPVPIEYHMETSVHSAIVCDMEEQEALVEIGLDFLFDRGFTVELGGTTLNLRQSWRSEHFDDVEYVYNHERGSSVREFLDKETQYEMRPNFRRVTLDPDDFIVADSVQEMQRDADKFGE